MIPEVMLYSLGLFGAFLLGAFIGMVLMGTARDRAEQETEEDLTDWDGDQ